jgi:hypothetical protein
MKYLVAVAIIVVLAIYLDLRFNGVLNFSQTNITRDTVVVNLPPQTINFPPGQPLTIINQPVPSNVDTGAILKAFFSQVTYLDSVDNDTLKIVLKEVIGQNKIISRELTHRLKIPITTVTNVYARPRMLMLGGKITKTDEVGLSASVGYLTNKDILINGSFDPASRSWGVGVLVPIKRFTSPNSPRIPSN